MANITFDLDASTVNAGGYLAIADGVANNGNTNFPSRRDFFTNNNEGRIRQNGNIDHFVLNLKNMTALTSLFISIWRKNGSTWDRIYQEDFIGQASVNTALVLTPSTTWTVLEGDYVGYSVVTGIGVPTYQFFSILGQVANSSYYVTDAAPGASGYNWAAQTAATFITPIHVFMKAPKVVWVGDSIPAGHPAHSSFIENSTTSALTGSPAYQMSQLVPFTYQNMGIGSQTTAQISARLTADALALAPGIVVYEGGVNDIAGAVAKATFIANKTTDLAAMQSDPHIFCIIVILIMPWTNGTTGQMQTRDDWNASLVALAANYSKAKVVDTSSYVGQFRAGGDANNLWDIKTAYNADGVHLNSTGYGQMAQAVYDGIVAFITANNFTINLTGTGDFSSGGLNWGGLSLNLNGTSHIVSGAFTCDLISFNPVGVQTITWTDSTIYTLNQVTRTGTGIITFQGSGVAGYTLNKPSGKAYLDFMSISRSTGTPSFTWYAGENSTNGGNNVGWIFNEETDIFYRPQVARTSEMLMQGAINN